MMRSSATFLFPGVPFHLSAMSSLEVGYADDALVIVRPRNIAMTIAIGFMLLIFLGLLGWGMSALLGSWESLSGVARLYYSTRLFVGLVLCVPMVTGMLDVYHPTRFIISEHGVAMERSRGRRSFLAWDDIRELIVEHTGRPLRHKRNYRIRLQGEQVRMSASTSMWRWSVEDLRDLAFTLGRRLRNHNPQAKILDYEEWVL